MRSSAILAALLACGGGTKPPPANVGAGSSKPVCPVMRDGLCHTHALIIVVELSPMMTGPRLAKVKEAIAAAAAALDAKADRFGVIVYAETAHVVSELGAPVKLGSLGPGAGGKADLDGALQLAGKQLRTIAAVTKHVIVVTDQGTSGSLELAKAMRGAGVTISAVGLVGANRNALYELTEAADGRLYMVEELDMLPRVFAKETREAATGGFPDHPVP